MSAPREPSRHFVRATALLFAVVFVVRLVPSLFVPMPSVHGDEYLYLSAAENIAHHGIPAADSTGSHRASSIYSLAIAPAFLAPVSRRVSLALVFLLNALAGASVVFPVRRILGRRTSPLPAVVGTVLASFLPALVGFQPLAMTEALFFPLLLWIWDAIDATLEHPSRGRHLLLGLLCGVAAVTRPQGWGTVVVTFGVLVARSTARPGEEDRVPWKTAWPAFPAALLLPALWIAWRRLGVPEELAATGLAYPFSAYIRSALESLGSLHGALRLGAVVLSDVGYVTLGSFLFFLSAALADGASLGRRLWRRSEGAAAVYSLFLLGVSLLHQNHFAAEGLGRYLYFGRYIEPVVLFAFLFGFPAVVRRGERLPRGVLVAAALLAGASMLLLPETNYEAPNRVSLAYLYPFAYRPGRIGAYLLLGGLLVAGTTRRFVPRILLPFAAAAVLFGDACVTHRTLFRSIEMHGGSTIGRHLATVQPPATVVFVETYTPDDERHPWTPLRDLRWRVMWLSGRAGHRFPLVQNAPPPGAEYVVFEGLPPLGRAAVVREGNFILAKPGPVLPEPDFQRF